MPRQKMMRETEQQSHGPDHAQLLARHRVDEVLVRFGQIEQLLPAVHEAQT